MYKGNELRITTPPCEHTEESGWCALVFKEDGHGRHFVTDNRRNKTQELAPQIVAYLPHSCEEWVIGGRDEILRLIFDLNRALEKLDEY